jgi:hypothetical protein
MHAYGPCPACGASKKLIFHALNIAISGDGRHMVLYGLIARGSARNKRQRDFKKRCVEAAKAACETRALFVNRFPFHSSALGKEAVGEFVKERTSQCPFWISVRLLPAEYGFDIALTCRKLCRSCSPAQPASASILPPTAASPAAQSIPAAQRHESGSGMKTTMKVDDCVKVEAEKFKGLHRLDSLSDGYAWLLRFYELNRGIPGIRTPGKEGS